MACLSAAPVHGQMGINWRRLTFFAPFVPPPADASSPVPMSAGNPTLPDSLEKWLAGSQVIEIGGRMAGPNRSR